MRINCYLWNSLYIFTTLNSCIQLTFLTLYKVVAPCRSLISTAYNSVSFFKIAFIEVSSSYSESECYKCLS